MQPSATIFLDRLQADSVRYVVPVYQRMYSWDESHCVQLWRDVIRAGESNVETHFTGSIVWVQDGGISGSGEFTALLIDGQQRMTTLSLLVLALADYAKAHDGKAPDGSPLDFKWKKLCANYLLHDDEADFADARRYKLTLSEEDNATFHSLIDSVLDPDAPCKKESERICQNYELLRDMLEQYAHPNAVWRGVRKLQVISVALDQGKDNPQEIFESMNSTGKDLSAGDLVRNYVLMGLPVKDQNRLYKNYWREMERIVRRDGREYRFDDFLEDYLNVVKAPSTVYPKDVYPEFKDYVDKHNWRGSEGAETLLSEMKRFAGYYERMAYGSNTDAPAVREGFLRLAKLGISALNPVLMELCDANDPVRGRIDQEDFAYLLGTIESYLVRRAVCDCATNSLTKFGSSIIKKLRDLDDDVDYGEAFRSFLALEAGTARRFPGNAEFSEALKTRDFYGMRKALYALNRLENAFHAKNPVNFFEGDYSIEHIMPQNALAHDEWVEMLGGEEKADEVHGRLLHTLGNLTVTAYNSELSDGAFEAKKSRMEGGFDHDVISLSQDCYKLKVWNEETIVSRAERLAKLALTIWPALEVDAGMVDMLGAAQKKSKGGKSVVGKAITLKDLCAAGYLSEGDLLFHEGKEVRVSANVVEDGLLRLSSGEAFKSPSSAAVRAIALLTGTGYAVNGWSFWHLDKDPKTILDDVRKRYRADRGLSTEQSEWNEWHIAFWNGFYELTSEMPDFCEVFGDLTERIENRSFTCNLRCGTPQRHISLQVLTRKANMGVICEERFDSAELYPEFHDKREEIMSSVEVGDGVWHWDELDEPKRSRIAHVHKRMDLNDEESRAEAYDWLVKMAWQFKRAFE